MTILIIGGAYQGKREFAKREFGLQDDDFAQGKVCTLNELRDARGVDGLHHFVRRMLSEGGNVAALCDQLADKVILCDEIGCGVIPFEKEQDTWREAVGRLCCNIAEQADVVVRIHAGIAQVIKGNLQGCKE